MKSIRLLFTLLFSFMLLAPAAHGEETAQDADQRLVGIWQEFEPSSNVIQFLSDHTVRLYLTKEEGGDMNIHWIGGTWKILPDSSLSMNMSANGRSLQRVVTLQFRKDEMVLIDDSQTETKHRRLSGEIPAKYRW